MKRNALTLLLPLSATLSLAQDSFDLAVSNVLLLQLKNVQKEVGISEAQRAKMNKFADQHKKTLTKLIQKEQAREKTEGNNYKPNEAPAQEAFVTMRLGVLKTLTPSQLKRLRELTLQDVGMSALLEPTVASRVGLRTEQIKTLKSSYEEGARKAQAVEDKALAPVRAEFQNKKPKDEAERAKLQAQLEAKITAAAAKSKPAIDKIKSATKAQFEKVLTPEQKLAWKALLGKTFSG